ncbi:AfsR/SARP family transcriptional regulator [Paractinoplanes hotanensis]|uniref:NB-ARC domain-containing protein n=1 Tax=Paractinoplanes hotanensis TaxID=2906497 RepID=A0ABT0YD79_9ACTN|nr:BTAD domain-containing putative transcriptional regulator [Actinoplanes hotanensis]MCM4083432.1 NB-ARC domain-containing protein [Actinoplanes hotanensis]
MAEDRPGVADLWIQVLGPVRVRVAGQDVDPRTRQQRLVLAILATRAGESTSVAELVELLWDHDPPASAVNVVHRHVGAIRRLLQPSLPLRSPGDWLFGGAAGYRLAADANSLDLIRFRDLVRRSRTADVPEQALALLVEALQLWRGPCAGAPELLNRDHPAFMAVDRECAEVARRSAESALESGRVRSVLGIVQTIATMHPLDEALQAQVMLMLSSEGRQAEATKLYQRLSARLMEELGADPSLELRQAHQVVLRGGVGAGTGETPQGRRTAPEDDPARRGPQAPAQLPPDLPAFSGRDDVVRRIIGVVNGDTMSGTSTSIVVVDGLPGIGKTTLAIHAGHQLADAYADGQLYVDLQGFHPRGEMLDPADVLHSFLGALHVQDAGIPAALHARAALFRSVLATRRMLIVLDNARDVDQVRHLLPGSAGCLVLVTSRNRLSGLATAYGAHMVTLQPLTRDDARQFLLSRTGRGAEPGDRDALDEIVERCAGLPLALAIVAARAADATGRRLSDIAHELSDAQGRLDGFRGDDMDNGLRTIFSWSYQMLSEPAAHLFRLLWLLPAVDMTVAAVASLAGLTLPESRLLLAELIRTRLISGKGLDRYGAHDLIRAYSQELSLECDDEQIRQDAVQRLFHHYVLSAEAAGSMIISYRSSTTAVNPGRVTVTEAPDAGAAVQWFDAEHHALRIVIKWAIDTGHTALAWQAAAALLPFYQMRGGWDEWTATMTVCLDAVVAAGDKLGELRIRRGLAGALSARGDYTQALRHLDEAMRLAIELGDRHHAAACEENRGEVKASQGDYRAAVGHYERAFAIFESDDDDLSCAHLLCYMAASEVALGNHERCAALLARAAPTFAAHDDTVGSGECHEILAASAHQRGDLDASITHWRQALDVYLGAGLLIRAARCWLGIGDTAWEQRDVASARRFWGEARTLLQGSDLVMLRDAEKRLQSMRDDPQAALPDRWRDNRRE